MKFSKTKKAFLGSVCTVLIVVGAYAPMSPTTPKAHAFLGAAVVAVVGDVPSEIQRILDGVGWMAAKTVVNSLTQSIVNWINSGFQGSPAFATDLNRNLGNLADGIAEDFLQGLDQVVINNTGFSIRAPFQDQIARALREEFYRTTSSYGINLRYPTSDCGGSTRFTFSSFNCRSQDAANNPFGMYMIARNELFKQLDRGAQTRIQELGWGKGFLSWRGSCGKFGVPSGTPSASASTTPTGTGALGHEGSHTSLSQAETTSSCPIRTPGAIIESTLGITATSPLRQLELADNINEIVGALVSQLVNQILGGTGLSGLSQPSSGGGASYLDQATGPAASLSGGFAQNISDTRTKVTSYQAGWQRIRDAANTARQACANNSAKAAEADTVLTTANARLTEATSALTKLTQIEAERARLSSGTTNDNNAITLLVNQFTTLLSSLGPIAEAEAESVDTGNTEPGSAYSRMVRLANSCR